MQWLPAAISLLQMILGKNETLNAVDSSALIEIKSLIENILSNNTRYCFDKKYECTYRNGLCYVGWTKDNDWTLEDIEQCPFRKKIRDD